MPLELRQLPPNRSYSFFFRSPTNPSNIRPEPSLLKPGMTNNPAHGRTSYFYLLQLPLVVLFAVWFYFTANSTFAPFDDEGFFLSSIRSDASGLTIYDQYFTIYGPFYYLYQRALFWLFRLPFDQAGIRLAALFSGSLAAALFLTAAYNLTRRPALAGLAGLFIIYCLIDFALIAGHPNEPSAVVVALLLCFLTATHRSERGATLALAAATLTLFFIKINLGALCLAASLLYLLWRQENGNVRGKVQPLYFIMALVAALCLPLVVVRTPLATTPLFQFSAALTVAIALVLLAAFSPAKEAKSPLGAIIKALLLLAAGIACGAALLIASGVTSASLYWGLFGQHGGIWGRYLLLPEPDAIIAASFIPSVLLFLARRRLFKTNPPLESLLLFFYGSAVLLLFFTGYRSHAFYFALAFLWLPANHLRSAGERSDGAMFVVFLGLMFSLLMFPRMLSSVPFWPLLLVAVVAVDRAWSGLGRLNVVQLINRYSKPASALFGALLLGFLVTTIARDYGRFAAAEPLALPGSGALRLEPERAAVYRRLVSEITPLGDTLFTVPGMPSLNLWSGIPEPTGFNFTNWVPHFPPAIQERIVEALRTAEHPLVVWNDRLLEFWGLWTIPTGSPLLDHIRADFCKTSAVGDFLILRARKDLPAGAECLSVY